MATYKYTQYVTYNASDAFDTVFPQGAKPAHSGIYRCEGCGPRGRWRRKPYTTSPKPSPAYRCTRRYSLEIDCLRRSSSEIGSRVKSLGEKSSSTPQCPHKIGESFYAFGYCYEFCGWHKVLHKLEGCFYVFVNY